MFGMRYEEHEMGAGRVDPDALGNRLRSGFCSLFGQHGSGCGWIGPAAVALVILSWWNDMSVPDIFAWLIQSLRHVLS